LFPRLCAEGEILGEIKISNLLRPAARLCTLAACLIGGFAMAQNTPNAPAGGPGPGPGPGQQAAPHETITPLNPPENTVYVASGSTGSNNGIILGSDGVIVVDTGVSTASENVELAELAKITSKPITTAILTHSDGDHVNGLSVLPAGITIIAQENCKKEMEAAENAPAQGGAQAAAQPKPPLPTRTVAMKDSATIGGVQFEFLHVAPAHTSGDLVVYLPAQKIVFTGDIIADNSPYPIIHMEKNGSSEGWIETVTAIVALDANTFVPGHGSVHTKTDIEQRLASVKERRAQIQSLVTQGKSLDDIKQQLGESAAPAPGGRGPRFPSFTDVVYQELTRKN
jgi:glyoxylase-like metal-dependent hydrolase (beta-lactamase superfamily II)